MKIELNKIIQGDCLDVMKDIPDKSINCCVTSPPYWGLRNYNCDGQLGLESTPEEYVKKMVDIFQEVKRVLRDDGSLWLNLGDSYVANKTGGLSSKDSKMTGGRATQETAAQRPDKKVPGLMPKNLVGIPWRVAFALQADGWYLRQDIIWAKPNPMPESVTDRCTKSHEYIFLLSKSAKYFYDHEAIKEPQTTGQKAVYHETLENHGWNAASGNHRDKSGTYGDGETRNKRSVWTVTTKPFKKAHFATFPTKLIEPCILAGCPKDGIVLDPFSGAGTTAFVAKENNRNFVGIEINQEYIDISNVRLRNAQPQLF